MTFCTDNYADIIDGPVYETDQKLCALLEPHIPSTADQIAEFRRELGRIDRSIECIPIKGSEARYACIDGVSYPRSKRYLRLRIDYQDVMSTRIADVVRAAYFDGARALAKRIAGDAVLFKPAAVRWAGEQIMQNVNWDGQRRIIVDAERDGIIVVIASYCFIAPVGTEKA